MSREKKYYLANLPVKTSLIALAATIKARWVCEQARRLKEELGLDHFEGRSGKAFTSCADGDDRLRLSPASPASPQQGGKKRINGPPPQPTLPALRHAIRELIA
jgi:hypothetical protein